MTCSYCGSRYSETEHRCRRCGRKPEDTLNGEFPAGEFPAPRTTGALANKVQPIHMVAPADTTPADSMPAPELATPVQGSLFAAQVIAMPRRVRVSNRAADGKTPTRRTPRAPAEGQGELELLAPAEPKTKTLSTTTVGSRIYCDTPVATPLHRALAGAIDWAMVLIGYGLFLAVFALFGGEFALTRPHLTIFCGALAVVASTYGLLWTIAGTESAGMRWTHLRLITFDGFSLDTRQRAGRFVSSCLSTLSVLGILWAMADEEGLGWQDHISRTFPTAQDLDSCVFRRR